MLKYVLQKIGITLLILLGVITLSFLLLHSLPGDAARAMAGSQATEEDIANMRASMGLDKPLFEQYLTYLKNLSHGNMGYSYKNHAPVWDLLSYAWWNTLKLTCTSLLLAVLIGIPVGIFAATHRGKASDTTAMAFSFVGVSMPSFWLALLLIVVFGVKLKWLPFYGMDSPAAYVLPSLTLGLNVAASIARLTRASMLEILGQDYVRTAQGKGLSAGRVIYLHALRNAAVPIVTIIGLQMGVLLSGQVVTETIFSWPGLGRMIVDALSARDILIVQGGILLMAVTFTLINLITDLLYGILDPRIRYE
ncbi:MAG: ABC transporter permease [Clostridia bacterium]|nr:ABC transporter permease [Clostridia bacterium]